MRSVFVMIVPVLFWTLACQPGQEGVSTYQVPKDEVPTTAVPSEPAPTPQGPTWTAPPTWQAQAASPPRLASFAIPTDEGMGDCSLIVLRGDGGGLAANLNRWRGQLGMSFLAVEAAREAYEQRESHGTSYWLADLTQGAEGEGFLVGVFPMPDTTLFIKLKAPSPAFEVLRAEFLQFCDSVRLPHPHHDASE